MFFLQPILSAGRTKIALSMCLSYHTLYVTKCLCLNIFIGIVPEVLCFVLCCNMFLFHYCPDPQSCSEGPFAAISSVLRFGSFPSGGLWVCPVPLCAFPQWEPPLSDFFRAIYVAGGSICSGVRPWEWPWKLMGGAQVEQHNQNKCL